ncbi:MAG: hypothetical protein HeimC2_23960 [Candidatus Heimdallarchaeota archaeon LC_2]|nr:MAG: hypothetical protein HeimC2_23960 [Candidatus Heimdallarchaeota archaeon LC_2]
METEHLTEWQFSRSVAGKIYFEWIKKNGLVELLLRPETIPSIFYQKKWPSENQDIIEDILLYLTSMSLVIDAGGTYAMDENYQINANKLTKQVGNLEKKHPSYHFIKYGLSILDNRLEGDSGQWDIIKYNFLFEQGLTQKAFSEFGTVKQHLKIIDRKYVPSEKLHTLIFGNFISNSINILLEGNEQIPEFDIITHDLVHKNRAITFCELKSITSRLSDRILSLDELKEIKKYDLILFPNTLGFYKNIKEQLTFLKSISTEDIHLFLYAPTDAKFGVGIEPLFHLHPDYKGIPKSSDFLAQAKAVGWSSSIRIGFNEEILLLTMG